MTQPTAVRSDDLINSFGVATHINYTDGQYLNVTKDISALQYLGLDHVRDAAPNPNYDYTGQVHLGAAADAGIKFTFVANDPNPALVVQRIHDFVVAHPGSVVGIEGPNEVNNWPVTYNGQSGTAGAQAYQQALFNAVNNDPLLKNIPVLGFTDYPVHASASDWNNIHPYPKNGDQPYNDIAGGASAQAAVDPGKPFAITELGYHTSLTADTAGGWEGVNEATQAKLLLNAMMDAALLGSRSTSIYQLLDAYADPQGSDQEKHFGLFRLDGTSKPAADAIHNLTSIMADAGGNASSFSASTLNYSISGLPSTGHSYLTQKSDGSFQIIAWGEPDIWNEVTDTPISAASTPVNVNLGQTFSTVQVFDPLQGTNATQTLHNVSSVSIGLTDHPLIIQTSTDKSTSIGTGSDQLVLRISQDAYQGDAQYTVSVDGKQIGGVLTAHA
ncbi:calcium-binding protein, partial [Methylobacterium pseudosasicola]